MRGEYKRKVSVIAITFIVCTAALFSVVSAGIFDWRSTITGRATQQNVGINITVGNNAPNVTFVSTIPAQSITENGATLIIFNVTVNDTDGFGNIDRVTARFNRTGEGLRQNSSCVQLNTFATTNANYSCTVQIWYFDISGDWGVNVTVNDTSNSIGYNVSTNFTLGETSAFVMSPGNLSFGALSPGASNRTATNDPLLLNNTGNKAITVGNIQLNSTNLVGESDNTKAIYAQNFSIGTTTGSSAECDVSAGVNNATAPLRGNFVGLNLSNMTRGNHSANDGLTGQEQLYFCIRTLGNELSSQSYSTLGQGLWTMKIV